MGALSITPNWDAGANALEFPAKELNVILADQYADYGFWQREYELYSHMKLTQDRTFVVHNVSSSSLLWQPHKSCSWDATNGMQFGKKEYQAIRQKLNTEWCYDETFGSLFPHFLEWNNAEPVKLNETGEKFLMLVVDVLLDAAVRGWNLSAAVGKFFTVAKATEEFNQVTPSNIQELFKATIAADGIAPGFLYLINQLGETEAHANINFDSVVQFTEDGIVGDLDDALKLITRKMTPVMKRAYRGNGETYRGVDGRQRRVTPVFRATSDWMDFIIAAYESQNNDIALLAGQKKVVTMKEVQDGNYTQDVYYINRIPVVPLDHEVAEADQMLKGDISAFFLTATGIISKGFSFDRLPNSSGDIGLRVQMSTDNKTYGQYTVLGHALSRVIILNSDLIAGQVKYRA